MVLLGPEALLVGMVVLVVRLFLLLERCNSVHGCWMASFVMVGLLLWRGVELWPLYWVVWWLVASEQRWWWGLVGRGFCVPQMLVVDPYMWGVALLCVGCS